MGAGGEGAEAREAASEMRHPLMCGKTRCNTVVKNIYMCLTASQGDVLHGAGDSLGSCVAGTEVGCGGGGQEEGTYVHFSPFGFHVTDVRQNQHNECVLPFKS